MSVAVEKDIDLPGHSIHLDAFFHHGQMVWQSLTFDLSPCGWSGFLGKSGIGKTTLLRCLAGLEKGQPSLFKNHQIALLAQNDNLLPWTTVIKNVAIGSILRREKPDYGQAAHLLERVGLEGYASSYPMNLSMGMRQRVALARTLYEKADLILLDEPFSALDTKIKYELYHLTQTLLKGKTVIIVTHDPLEALTLCDRIYLFKGRPPTLVSFPTTQKRNYCLSSTAKIAESSDLERLMEMILCD